MKKTHHFLLPVAMLFFLQSCKRDLPFDPFNRHSLLISKVTGKFESDIWWGPNAYAYDDDGNLFKQFTYGPPKTWLSFRPLQQIRFIGEGTYDFQYDGLLPKKVTDNSAGATPPPHWRFYYDYRGLIKKVEWHPHFAGDPSEYEFYSYNHKRQLTSFIYGTAIDSPSFKIEYKYDDTGNIKEFAYYVPLDTGATDITALRRIKAAQPLLKKLGHELTNKLMTLPRAKASQSSGIQYSLLLTVRITTDNKINPYSQQDHLLFYLTNRGYELHLNPYFIGLLKSNPVRVDYEINPELGDYKGTTAFAYTYNTKGYPITVHEQAIDPEFVNFGDYVENSKIEYVRNSE